MFDTLYLSNIRMRREIQPMPAPISNFRAAGFTIAINAQQFQCYRISEDRTNHREHGRTHCKWLNDKPTLAEYLTIVLAKKYPGSSRAGRLLPGY